MSGAANPALRFAALHHGATPLLLPNAWDLASAAALAGLGHQAIGSTSLGVAASHGLPDGRGLTRGPTLELAAAWCRLVPALITMDIENGFSDDPGEVADVCVRLRTLGVVGVNVEDSLAGGGLRPPELQGRIVSAVKAAAPDLFVNARVDTHWLRRRDPSTDAETLRRARRYVDAGADGIFIPGVADDGDLAPYAAAIGAPLNALFDPARHSVAALAELGVRRISTGSLLFRAAFGALDHCARAVREGTPFDWSAVPAYSETP